MNEGFDIHLQELRRGTVVVACLQLLRTAGYGYGLLEDLERHGFATDANTLYPLLRRLEKQGYLTSEWNTDEARPRKFYRTSADGVRLADTLVGEWAALTRAIASVTEGVPDPVYAYDVPGDLDSANPTNPTSTSGAPDAPITTAPTDEEH